MLKYKAPMEYLQSIKDITNKISSVLLSLENFGEEDFSQIEDFFNERQDLINQLETLLASEEGKEYLKNNSTFFNNELKIIQDIDEYNIIKMKENLDDIKEKLRILIKSKSVLKYNLT